MKKFTKDELRDIIISILALSMFFAYPDFGNLFITSLSIIFISFILRQMIHKAMAHKLQCTATYKLFTPGLILGFGTMFLKEIFGFVVMLTGYLEIVPYKFGRWGIKVTKLTPYDLGIITLAGIFVNLFFAYFFLLFENPTFQLITMINALLAFFSLIPIPPLDGSKIFMWTIWGWVFLVLLSITAFILVVV